MSDSGKQWEGLVVDDRYPLIEHLGDSPNSALFLTEIQQGDRRVTAAIKLIPAAPENEERQLSRWRLAAGLRHPHLLPLFDCGRCQIEGYELLYVVTAPASENLAEVISERALTAAETAEMLEPVLSVLAYLHDKNLVHGDVRPVNIMAEDDHLWLSSDTICTAGEPPLQAGAAPVDATAASNPYAPPESAPGIISLPVPAAAAGDVWSLGVTLFEALTQTLPPRAPTGQGADATADALPEPFGQIVRHCLVPHHQSRWTVAEIAACLHGAGETSANPTLPRAEPSAASVRTTRHSYGYAAAAVFALLLVIFLGAPRLFRGRRTLPQIAAPSAAQALQTQTAAQQATPETNALKVLAPQKDAQARRAAASLLPSGHSQDGAAGIAPRLVAEKSPTYVSSNAGSPTSEVIRQVLPTISDTARNTIRGTVRIAIRADVEASGSVARAQIESGGSKYFARQALNAAQQWQFRPANAGAANRAAGTGGAGAETWLLRFEFTRADTKVIPIRQTP